MKRVSALIIGSSLMAFSGGALAEDGKVYMGAQCTWQNATAANHSSHRLYNSTGTIQNSSCPVTREILSTEAVITYAAATTTDAVTRCRLEMRPSDGGSLVGWNHYNIANLGGGIRRFEWFGGDSAGNAYSRAGLAIECSMPEGSSLYLYELREED
jgi:hypothetical protein